MFTEEPVWGCLCNLMMIPQAGAKDLASVSLHCITGLGLSSHATVPSLPRRAQGRPALLHMEQGEVGLAAACMQADPQGLGAPFEMGVFVAESDGGWTRTARPQPISLPFSRPEGKALNGLPPHAGHVLHTTSPAWVQDPPPRLGSAAPLLAR